MDEPRRIGDYELLTCIGRGAMGEVWRARHGPTSNEAALKLFQGSGEVAHASLIREVETYASLDHPGIVRLLDYGTIEDADFVGLFGPEPGSPWFVMEMVDGGSLADRLPADWLGAKRVLRQILEALAHAHARGVLHRDLKPSNVLWEGEQDIKLSDFGLAYLYDARQTLSAIDTATITAGTPLYMAPEQLRGHWRDFGPWTDLYAFGCLAWSVLTGSPPFTGETMTVIVDQAKATPPSFKPRLACPPDVEPWLRKLLAKQPTARFIRAVDARLALEALADPPTSPLAAGAAQRSLATGLFAPPTMTVVGTGRSDETEAIRPSRLAAPELDDGLMSRVHLPADWGMIATSRASASSPSPRLGALRLRSTPFVGRRVERDTLWSALGAVYDDRSPRAVVISGLPGSGKSALCQWLCRTAEEVGGALVFSAIHGERGQAMSGPAQLLEDVLRCRELTGQKLAERIRHVLALHGWPTDEIHRDAAVLIDLIQRQATDEDVERVRLHGEKLRDTFVLRFLARVTGGRPFVVWIDDAQWGPESRTMVRHAFEAVERAQVPALFLLTVRSDLLTALPAASADLPSLERHQAVVRLELGPMPDQELRSLARWVAPADEELCDVVVRQSAGSPLTAIQWLQDWGARRADIAQEASPRATSSFTAAAVWDHRIGRVLDGTAHAHADMALELAALLGHRVVLREWASACHAAGTEVPADLVGLLVEHGLALTTHDGFSFIHGLLVDVLASRAEEAGRLARAHGQCAAGVEATYGRKDAAVGERIAYHLAASGAGEQALDLMAHAVERYRRDGHIQRSVAASETYGALCDQIGLRDDDPRRGFGLWLRALAIRATDDFVEAAAAAEEVLQRFPFDSVAYADATALSGILAWQRGDAALGGQRLEAGLAGLVRLEAWCDAARAARWLGHVRASQGHMEVARDLMTQSWSHAERAGSVEDTAHAWFYAGRLYIMVGEFDAAEEAYLGALAQYEELGMLHMQADTLNGLGELARMREDYEAAERWYERAIRDAAASGKRTDVPRLNYVLTRMQNQRMAGVAADLQDLWPRFEARASWVARTVTMMAMAIAMEWEGDGDGFERHEAKARALLAQRDIADLDIGILGMRMALIHARRSAQEAALFWARTAHRHFSSLRTPGRAEAAERLVVQLSEG